MSPSPSASGDESEQLQEAAGHREVIFSAQQRSVSPFFTRGQNRLKKKRGANAVGLVVFFKMKSYFFVITKSIEGFG